MNQMVEMLLGIINRQKAEIETFERKLYDEGEALLALNHQLLTVKAEAIKKCLNWVLSLFPEDKNFTTISRFTVNRKLKEMVGESNV